MSDYWKTAACLSNARNIKKPSLFSLGETIVEHVRTAGSKKQPGPQILNARKADDQIVICIPMYS